MSDRVKIAVAGFRHPHIQDVVTKAQARMDVQIVAGSEAHAPTRQDLQISGLAFPIFESLEEMVKQVDCDVIAIGDYYGIRGSVALRALTLGKHILSDKPLCTSLTELEQIENLARSRGLTVGCQLDMRDLGVFLRLRDLVRNGAIGEVQAIAFNGQHPLNFGRRAGWYFEPGKHGGTLNDIAVHAFDYIPWVTGQEIAKINAARCWSTQRHAEIEHFQDAGQVMLTLDNGAGVLGDVSYLAPDSFGYTLPQYWEWTFWGTAGMMRTNYNAASIQLYRAGQTEVEIVDAGAGRPGQYIDAFLREGQGRTQPGDLDSAQVFRASQIALQVQELADSGEGGIRI